MLLDGFSYTKNRLNFNRKKVMNTTLYPLVSVMIPYYNCKEYIEQTILSVERQTYPHIEIIIVDDGSDDTHKTYLEALIRHKPSIRLIYQSNRGVAAARNTAARYAQGQYFIFLDADDVIGATYIEQSVEQFWQQPDLALVYPKTELFGAEAAPFTPPVYKHYPDVLAWNTFPTPSIHKATDYHKIGGFNEDLSTHEDWDYWIRLLLDNKQVYQIPEVLYFYRKRDNGTSLMDGLKEHPEKLVHEWQQVYLANQEIFLQHNLGYFNLIKKIKEMKSLLNYQEIAQEERWDENGNSPAQAYHQIESNKLPIRVGIVLRTTGNRSFFLKRALNSIASQSYPYWHLVVVNDGGETVEIDHLLQPYQMQLSGKLEVIHFQHAQGMAQAANIGLSHLDTDLAVFHDDDDSWSPDFLLRATQTYQEIYTKIPSIRGVVCHVNRVVEDVEGNIIRTRRVEHFNQHIGTGLLPLSELSKGNLIPLIGFVFDLQTAKETECFDPYLPVLSDWDFCLKFMIKSDVWVQGESLAFTHQREKGHNENHRNQLADITQVSLYTVYLKNKWLRQDLRGGQASIGMMMNLIK